MQTIHDRVSKLIKDVGCSEREFSVKLGHTRAWANNLLKQKSKFSHEDILKIESVFKVNPMYLLKGQTPMYLQ